VPRPEDLDTEGLDLAPEKLAELLSVDEAGLSQELEQISEHLAKFGDRLPGEIRKQFEALQARLG
jgi:phosphoenolpyruvate carboxykinase (GTP)